MKRTEDGYRYVRGYRTRAGWAWALFERRGGRMVRCGTARDVRGYVEWITTDPDLIASEIAAHEREAVGS